jgi:alkylhydroperoxidase/carboxymuconolactone decarboxylase family protein YurZ
MKEGEDKVMTDKSLVSNAFQTFIKEAPDQQKSWMEMVQKLGEASKLDAKTQSLSYLAVLSVLRLESGLPFHVRHAKSLGATREEIVSAILVGLPAAGHVVVQALPIALQAFDNE